MLSGKEMSKSIYLGSGFFIMQKKDSQDSVHLPPIEFSKNQLTYFVVVSISLWTIAFSLWFQTGIDQSILFYLNAYHVNSNLVMINRLLTDYGMSVITLVFAGYLALSFKIANLENGRQAFLFFILSFAVSSIAGDVLKEIIDRTRPFVQYRGQIHSFSRASSPSFPSGHATKSISLVLPFIFFCPYQGRIHNLLKWLLGFLALGVCFSRMFLAAHFFSDIVAAAALVFTCLPFSAIPSNHIGKRMKPARWATAAKRWMLVYLALSVLLHVL